MRSTLATRHELPKVRAEPHPGWFLLWVPLFLVALDDSPSLTGAMTRLGTVLLLGALTWATGRGPGGAWAERGFAALLLVGWFVAAGTAFRALGPPTSIPARLALASILLLGPAFLLWAWGRRSQMTPVSKSRLVPASGSALVLLPVLLSTLGVVFVLDRLVGLHAADLLVVITSLGFYALFRSRGRVPPLRGLG